MTQRSAWIGAITIDCDDADVMRHFYAEAQAQRLGVVTLDALSRAGLDQHQALEALRVLIVKTMGFAAISARPDPSQPGVLSTADLRRNFGNSLTWLLKGIRS